MAAPPYTIRLMEKSDIPQALDVWKETGLQEGTKSVDTFFEVDPEGFWVAVSDETGDVLGVCSAVMVQEDLGHIGLYAVREKYRGQGIGQKLWKACYDHIGDHNGSVNAVPGKLEIYRDKGGFPVEETTWRPVAAQNDGNVVTSVLVKAVAGVDIKPIKDDVLKSVQDYDAELMGQRRDKIVALTVSEGDSEAFAAMEGDKCVGYGVIKMSIQGYGQIGPLYADNQEIAEALLRRLVESFPQGKGLAFMSTSANEGAKSIMSKLNLEVHEECARCYKKFKVDVDQSKVFGQLNLNFTPY